MCRRLQVQAGARGRGAAVSGTGGTPLPATSARARCHDPSHSAHADAMQQPCWREGRRRRQHCARNSLWRWPRTNRRITHAPAAFDQAACRHRCKQASPRMHPHLSRACLLLLTTYVHCGAPRLLLRWLLAASAAQQGVVRAQRRHNHTDGAAFLRASIGPVSWQRRAHAYMRACTQGSSAHARC